MPNHTKDNSLVVKSNDLIEASYKLTLGEQRVILNLASQIKKDDVEFKIYRIKINELRQLLEIKNNSYYKDIKNITKELMKKVFSIHRNENVLQISWLSSAEYISGEGVVELCFDPKLKPFLLQLKERFTSYSLEYVNGLKSSYSIRIYELLKQYQRIGHRVMSIDEIRAKIGIEENEYKLYHQIKQRVILTAYKELKEKCDIYFEFEEIKDVRKVSSIKFIIYPNLKNATKKMKEENKPFELTQNNANNSDVLYIIEQFKILSGEELHINGARKLIEEKGMEKVQYYLENFNKLNMDNIDNKAGLFFNAVMDEYIIPKTKKVKSSITQHVNYESRVYDKEYFESLYEEI